MTIGTHLQQLPKLFLAYYELLGHAADRRNTKQILLTSDSLKLLKCSLQEIYIL
jgi:hypothetical protein